MASEKVQPDALNTVPPPPVTTAAAATAPIANNNEAAVSKEQPATLAQAEEEQSISAFRGYIRVFTYLEPLYIFFEIVALIAAIGSGAALALVNIVFGDFITVIENFVGGRSDRDEFMRGVTKYCLYFVYIGIARFALAYIYTTLSTWSAYRLVRNIRRHFFKSALSQEIAFFDHGSKGSISMQATSNGTLIQSGIAEKLALCFQSLATFVAAFIIAFITQWKLTLILIFMAPALIILMGVVAGMEAGLETRMLDIYAQAGSFAESILSTPRTVQAFTIRKRLLARYEKYIDDAKVLGDKKGPIYGFMFSFEYFIIYSGLGLAFWQGIKMLSNGELDTLGGVFTVIMSVIIATTSITMVAPYTIAFSRAAKAAAQLFTIIDRKSQIDPFDESGERPESTKGVIDIKNITFSYPTRPTEVILKDFSLHVPAGKVTALVGASGSGKSTIIGLLERWYMPASGSITLDGKPIDELNLNWLRTNVRLVQQEPVLFNTTVFENIANGLIGTKWEHSPKEEQMQRVQKAAEFAFAHDFISELPGGYECKIGERGGLLSGGQKQRIAIARSIVSEPTVLLLDESTSALDGQSEQIVQRALDNVSANRTTITIAHKLSTIQKADQIVVMSKGQILEQGTHSSLLAAQGSYARLVQAQQLGGDQENTSASDGSSASDKENNNSNNNNNQAQNDGGEVAMSRTLTRYPTADQKHLESLAERDNFDNHRHVGVIASVFQLLAEAKELKIFMLILVIASLGACAILPGQAIILGKVFNVFTLPPDEMRREGNIYALSFFMIGVGCLFVYGSIGLASNRVAQTLNKKSRMIILESMLRQDIQFFDRPENSVGANTSRLEMYPQAILELMGFNVVLILICVFTIVSSSILAIVVSWRLGLVASFAGLPAMVFAGYARIRLETRMDAKNSQRVAGSAAIASESVGAIRTVSSLAIEKSMLARYTDELDHASRASLLPLLHMMFWFSFTQSVEYFILGLGFWYGCKLVSEEQITFYAFIVAFMGVFFAGQYTASMFGYTSSITKGKSAANYLAWIKKLQPTVQETDENRSRAPADGVSLIQFENMQFSYPLRANARVLRGINLEIKRGQSVAFVGGSGHGKSTMVAMLERFYDPTSGSIKVDGEALTKLNPKLYRRNVALVQQEPVLYPASIRDNIMYGIETDDEAAQDQVVDDAKIEAALRAANAWDFVSSLPEGMNTPCGANGSQLSGGQKQRVSIARALIRDPNVILLDEATSALDTTTEKLVQQSLAEAATARSRIIISVAHRLSTIKDCDAIYVFDTGKIVEAGTHDELVALGGKYYQMCLTQSLDKEAA